MSNKALEWESMVREVKALRTTNARFKLALQEIDSPLHFMQSRAALNNEKLDGEKANAIATSPAHLQSIARAALRGVE